MLTSVVIGAKMDRKIVNGFNIVVILSFLQAALRLFFGLGGLGLFGEGIKDQIMSLIENPVSNELLVIALPFLLLGIFGAVASSGLLLRRQWGLYVTYIVCAATIAYDTWAIVAIQDSAEIGLTVPLLTLIYLMARKDHVLRSKKVAA